MKKINVLPQTFYEFRCDKSLIDEIIPHVKEEEYIIQCYGETNHKYSDK